MRANFDPYSLVSASYYQELNTGAAVISIPGKGWGMFPPVVSTDPRDRADVLSQQTALHMYLGPA